MRKMITVLAVLTGMVASAQCEPSAVADGREPLNKMEVGRPRRVELVSRQSADVYVVMGRPERFRTLGCTVSATLLDAVVLPGPRPFLVFIDRDGEEEGRCELDVGRRHVRTAPPEDHRPIRRQIAVAR